MISTEEKRQQQLLHALQMTQARLRSIFSTVNYARERSAQGVPVDADLRVVCSDIVMTHDWLLSQIAEALSDSPMASSEGAPEVVEAIVREMAETAHPASALKH